MSQILQSQCQAKVSLSTKSTLVEMYIDLQPFVNLAPYMVPEDTSLTKVSFCYILNSYRTSICLLVVQ
jgi:hypothetical protein